MTRHQCVIVKGDTGCGKTTTLPPMSAVMDAMFFGKQRVFVVVALPKKILVEHAAAHLRKHLKQEGWMVGHVHKDVQEYSEWTRVLFATTGWLARKLSDDR